ncbi:MAG: DUF1523 family protein [Alphaproteobacteria bacterium]|nr:DUF1523 family protein [Alphaproteobacteria bacterium]
MRTAKRVIIALLIAVVAGFLHFYLPRHDVLRVVGTDVKRMDAVSRDLVQEGDGTSTSRTRDVRFVNAVWSDGKPRVYRNEETNWGFPWYLKFDSGNIQAVAQDLVSTAENPKWVVVTHYGWRIEIFSMFPNVVDIARVDSPDHRPIPWFNIVFFVGLAALFLYLWTLVRRIKMRHIDPLLEKWQPSSNEPKD